MSVSWTKLKVTAKLARNEPEQRPKGELSAQDSVANITERQSAGGYYYSEADQAFMMWHTTGPAAVELGIAKPGERPPRGAQRAGGDEPARHKLAQLRLETVATLTGSWVTALRTLARDEVARTFPAGCANAPRFVASLAAYLPGSEGFLSGTDGDACRSVPDRVLLMREGEEMIGTLFRCRGWWRLSIAVTLAVASTVIGKSAAPALAYGTSMAVSIPTAMTLATSSVEVEFPVTVTCDPIGGLDTYVEVHLSQAHTNATGSEVVSPLTCDSSPHTYLLHVFADNAPFEDGPTTATAFAENIAANFVQQSGGASQDTKLVVGSVADSADAVVGLGSGGTYSLSIGNRATLEGPFVGGKGYGRVLVNITASCTAPSSSGWIGVALEGADGARLVLGADTQEGRGNIPEPQVICDGQTHTYAWLLHASTGSAPYDGVLSGENISVAVWIEDAAPSTPQGSQSAPNGDAVATVHATNG